MTKVLLSSISAMILLGGFAGQAIAESGVGGVVVKDAVPYEHWALPSTMRSAQVSPDGKYVAFIRNQSKKGEPLIEVYETADMKKKPYRVGAKSLEITGFSWISGTDMTVSFQKQVSKRIKGFNQGAFKNKLARFSMKSKKFEELSDDNFAITMVNALVDDPDHVLMRFVEVKEQQSRRAPNFYKYNLDTGSKKLVLKGNREQFGYVFDKDGNPRLSSTQTAGGKERIFSYRPVGGTGWTEFARTSRETFQRFQPVGTVEGNDDLIYVLAHNNNDKVGLWKYSLSQKKFADLVYRRKDVDRKAFQFMGIPRRNYEYSLSRCQEQYKVYGFGRAGHIPAI